MVDKMLATQGLGTGGAIVTQGYASWEFITVVDFYDETFYILRTQDDDFQINTINDEDFYINQVEDNDFLILRVKDGKMYIVRTWDQDFEG